MLAALVYNIHHTRHLHRGALEDATAAADAAWLHLVLVTKQPSDAAKEIKRRLSVAARLWVFRVLMVASLMAFECDHDGTSFWGGAVVSDDNVREEITVANAARAAGG